MANNYTQATLTPDVTLTDDLRIALRATGATVEHDGAAEGRDYVYWEESWADEATVDGAEMWDLTLAPEYEGMAVERILRRVLEGNPGVELLTVEAAFTCSKMRPGEFGGFGLYVTPTEYCYIGSGHVKFDPATKRLTPSVTVVSWDGVPL